MSDTNLPILKFSWNTPVLVSFKYDPSSAFKKEGEYKGAKTVSYSHKVQANGQDMMFFATEKQQKEILMANCERGVLYQIVKQEIPGSKSYQFLIRKPGGESSELDTFLDSEEKTPINANKTSQKDGQTMGMCFKIACDRTDDIEEAKSLTKQYYRAFQELMSE